ncbi:MAG TPA: ComEA family DNA-binding protein [Acidimicrobiia bacterium]|nr:ComEA family DNA-binding protein [Acidimicrobiia bacterium]
MPEPAVPPRLPGAAGIPTLPTADPSSPADRLAFWGHERGGRSRPSLGSWFDRLRGDPRAGAVALLVVAIVSGLIWYRVSANGASAADPASTNAATAGSSRGAAVSESTSTTRPSELVVHVAGAVARPGIVQLPAGARVVDAIDAAGGPGPDADLDRLNLAAKVTDGQRVAVGRPGEPLPAAIDGGAGGGDSTTAGPVAPLDLNLASQADLEELPGIGPVLAAAILSERQRRGGFESVADLRGVRGIGEQRFADLRELVTV